MIDHFKGNKDWRKNFYIYSISLVSRRIPTPIFHIGGRFYLYSGDETSPQVLTLSTAIELFLIGQAGLICYVMVLPFYSTFPVQFPSTIVTLFSFIFILSLVFFPNLIVNFLNIFLKKHSKINLEANLSNGILVLWLFIYEIVWLTDGTALYLVAQGLFDYSINLPDTLGVSTLASLVGFISQFLPVGFGLKELTYAALFNHWYPVGVGVVIAISYRILLTIIEVFWAWLCRLLFIQH